MNLYDKIKIIFRLAFDARHPVVFSFHDCLPDIFSRYMETLIFKRCRILGAQEFLERLSIGEKRGALGAERQREVLLSFDDGRRNCWTVIFPILKKYRAKAVFFVIPSRVTETDERYPNLEDFWAGRVSWEALYQSHQKQPYLTWRELAVMQESGLVDIFPHGFRHDIVDISARVTDFQHPGVYEMPVYFDEWFQKGMPALETIWGEPVYERAWSPGVGNVYIPDRRAGVLMNDFVRSNGGFLFFRKKGWRKKLFEYFASQKKNFSGHFKKNDRRESVREAVFDSLALIEERLRNRCLFFSLPLYQASDEVLSSLNDAGYRVVFGGPLSLASPSRNFFFIRRVPGFWLKFLQYF